MSKLKLSISKNDPTNNAKKRSIYTKRKMFVEKFSDLT